MTEDGSSHYKSEAERVWKKVEELRKKGLLPEPSPEDIANEPTALANSGYRERAERESLERKYPPISPEKSTSKPVGALGRRKEEEEKKKEEMIRNSMRIEISLDPEIEWVVKTVEGKSYLSVKQN